MYAKIKHECRLVRVKSETIMGRVYPRVRLDCVGLGQKFSTFNESGWDGYNCKKCVKVYQCNFYCISALFASFFVGSGFVDSRTRALHGLDWVSYKSDASAVSTTSNISLRKFRGR